MSIDHGDNDDAGATELAPGIMTKLADRGMSQISLLRDAWPFLSGSVLHHFDLVETRYGTRLGDVHIRSERDWRDVVDQHLTDLAHDTSPTDQVRAEFEFCGKEAVFGKSGPLVRISFDIDGAQMLVEVHVHEQLGAGRYPHLLVPSSKTSGSIEMVLAWFAHASEVLRAKYGSAVSLED